jgi:Domain of unknown function (DUF1918)
MTVPETLKKGDRISSDVSAVGHSPRTGTVRLVLGEAEHLRYEVEWDSGDVSIVYPAHVQVQPVGEHRPRARKSPRKAPPHPHTLTAVAGDRLVVRPHHQGEPERDAEIVEALGPGGTPPFRLIWSDTGQEALLFPSTDAYVDHVDEAETAR